MSSYVNRIVDVYCELKALFDQRNIDERWIKQGRAVGAVAVLWGVVGVLRNL